MREQPLRPGRPLGFQIHRVPFFLEPSYPEDESWSETNVERKLRKFGSADAWAKVVKSHRLAERGAEVGIEQFENERVCGSTVKSHRLVQWVTQLHGSATAERLYDHLNEQHFIEGRKLNDTDLLVECAVGVGLPADEVRDFLSGNEGRSAVLAMFEEVKRYSIHSIPTFVFDGRLMVQGAAHADEIERVLRSLEQEVADGEGGALRGRPAFALQH